MHTKDRVLEKLPCSPAQGLCLQDLKAILPDIHEPSLKRALRILRKFRLIDSVETIVKHDNCQNGIRTRYYWRIDGRA